MKKLIVMMLLIALVIQPSEIRSQQAILGGTLFGGILVKEVLEDISTQISEMQSNLKITTKEIVSDTVMQAEASLNRLRIELADDLNKLVKETSSEMQMRLNNLHNSVSELSKNIINDFKSLTRETVLNIRAGIAGISLIGGDVGLTYIENTTIPYTAKGIWEIEAQGTKIGFDSSKWKSDASLSFELMSQKYTLNNIETSETVSYTHLTLPTTPYV